MQISPPAETFVGIPSWNDVLGTKTVPPRLPGTAIVRQRLIDRLNVFSANAVVLVVAPAGFGKTTLLVQWRNQPGVRSAWVSLDGSERTAAQFVYTMVAAFVRAFPEHVGACEQIVTFLESEGSKNVDNVVQWVTEAATAVPYEFTIILDDYDNVESAEIHAFVNRLIQHLPRNMHLIIGSRTMPPLQISRLRAQGLLREMRAPQLRFQPDETREFLAGPMELRLTEHQFDQLEGRTEGWAAGLQLAALSLQDADDVQSMIDSFSGTSPYVLDYLVDEILQRQPENVIDFLLKTSILERLSGELCDYVIGGKSGHETLERLEQMNLPIVAIDERHTWYRYHPLLADVLQLRLRQVSTEEEIRALHRRAAEWYLANGCVEYGVGHALTARDLDVVRRLVEPVGLPLVLEFKSIRQWLMQLPDEELQKSAALAVWAGWTLLTMGRPKDAARMVTIAEDHGDLKPNVQGYVLTLRARLAALNCNGPRSIADAQAALDDVPVYDHTHRAVAYYALGMGYHVSGRPVPAEEAFDEARRQTGYLKELNNTMTLIAVTYRAKAILLQGRVFDSIAALKEADDLAKDFAIPKHGAMLIHNGDIFLQRGEFESARAAFLEAMAIGRKRSFLIYLSATRVKLVAALCALGDLAGADGIIGELRQWSIDNDNDRYLVNAEAIYMQALIAKGWYNEPTRWIERVGVVESADAIPFDHEREFGVLARLWIARGFADHDPARVERGLALIQRLRDAAEESYRRLDLVRAESVRAVALAKLRRDDAYLVPLETALRIAVAEHAYYPLFDDEAQMRELLNATRHKGQLRELIDTVDADLSASIANRRPAGQAGISEPLSEREYDVLRQLASGLSTKDIADTLIVSVNTVKTHIRHIYEKLDAHNRTSALSRARELGLLE